MDRETAYTFAILDGVSLSHEHCFLAQFSDVPCDGRMQKAHLLPKQLIKKALRGCDGVVGDGVEIMWDRRVWRPACYRHHTMLDQSRTLRMPRSAIPTDTEAYARELGLEHWLAREYGEREEAAA